VKRSLLFVTSLLPAGALAHPGHGAVPAASWLHGLEPAHFAPVLVAFIAARFAHGAIQRRAAARGRRR
jgi:hypothetical protein